MTPKEKAEYLVNQLGLPVLAILAVELMLDELNRLYKPEYITFVIDHDPTIIMDGYERVEFWNEVKKELGSSLKETI